MVARWLCLTLLLAAAPAARAAELLVFAAASTTEAMEEVAAAYERTAGVKIRFSFGGSSDLARQIIAGAPADVFLSADEAQMDRVEKAGRVRHEDRVPLLSNSLVIVLATGTKTSVQKPGDLAGLPVLSLADPTSVPAGVYAKKWLERLGVWSQVEPDVVPMLDVRAALAAVVAGRADGAIVYATDLRLAKDLRTVPDEVVNRWQPSGAMPRISCPVAPIDNLDSRAARAFVGFLNSTAAGSIFHSHGFSKP